MIKIDLGGENYANIAAFRNSNPLELAKKFCNDYSLPETIIEPLCYRIRTNIRTHFVTASSPGNRIDNRISKAKASKGPKTEPNSAKRNKSEKKASSKGAGKMLLYAKGKPFI